MQLVFLGLKYFKIKAKIDEILERLEKTNKIIDGKIKIDVNFIL